MILLLLTWGLVITALVVYDIHRTNVLVKRAHHESIRLRLHRFTREAEHGKARTG